MGIISVRVSGDIPIQSEYFPLISLYFFLSLFFTFTSFLWFATVSILREKKYLPLWLIKLSRRKKIIDEICKNSEHDKLLYIEKEISILNSIFFVFIFISMLVSYITIWVLISF